MQEVEEEVAEIQFVVVAVVVVAAAVVVVAFVVVVAGRWLILILMILSNITGITNRRPRDLCSSKDLSPK